MEVWLDMQFGAEAGKSEFSGKISEFSWEIPVFSGKWTSVGTFDPLLLEVLLVS
jgi:hypothetical protein